MSHIRSRRSTVFARRGMVATSQPLATQAGLRVLQDGGHAVDAAVAAGAVLAVVEPGMTGIGGDVFALVWDARSRRVEALNGSGRQAAAASADDVRAAGHETIPDQGPGSWFAVSVPGTVDGWQRLLERHGRLTLADALAPAVQYARDGFPVHDLVARYWKMAEEKLQFRPSGAELLPRGQAPGMGEVVTLPELARSLETVAEGGAEAFYQGDIGRRIADFVQSEGGWLTAEDLARHRSDWDQPIASDYRGVTVWECPPNGQGLAALAALNIAEGFDLRAMGSQSLETYHHLIEAMRLGFADTLHYVADPRAVPVPTDALLSKAYAADRRAEISPEHARPGAGWGDPLPAAADTTYLSVVDGEGNACSFINSLFHNFGTGLVVPGTGIALQNRGSLFSLDPSHPNYLGPSQRPYHTIIPALATRGGELWLSFGVMGGFQQPQGHLQVIANMVDFDLDPQSALDAPRFRINFPLDDSVMVEEDLDEAVVSALRRRGHEVKVLGGYDRAGFGGGQIIARDPETGVLSGGTEPRKDGAAAGW